MELNFKEQITSKQPSQSFPSIISNVTNDKNEVWKTVSQTRFQKPSIWIRHNLLQVCPSVPTFVFAVLLIPPFNVFERWFLCFTQSCGSSYCQNFDKIRDTAIIAVLINPRRSRILLFPDCFRFCRLMKTQHRRYPRSFRMDGDKSGESGAFLFSRRVPVLCDGRRSFPTNQNSNLYRRGRWRWISLITNPTNPLNCWAPAPLSRKFQFLADFSISG